VIHLHAGPVISTQPPIVDPDPLLSCDLMDGRDAFLTLARDKHWEFSSLRRSKWSTLCMLVELHTQGQDRFVYTCNECKHHVETRWHCTVCEVSTTTYLLAFPHMQQCPLQYQEWMQVLASVYSTVCALPPRMRSSTLVVLLINLLLSTTATGSIPRQPDWKELCRTGVPGY
jgi:hypothetical protein